MLFSSIHFLFGFLPFVLLGNALLSKNRSLQNGFLVLCSLGFYAWGEPLFVLVMIGSILLNYALGLLVAGGKKRLGIFLAVFLNLALLFVFKYLGFSVQVINEVANTAIPIPQIRLPIGISFFTFQAMSYVLDISRQRGEAQKNPLNVALYISLFPQLIAGPIVRYQTIAEQIRDRKTTVEGFSKGMCRFVLGLAKKVLIADKMAVIAAVAFDTQTGLTAPMAWLGAIAFTLQIYFDFSGYSDMAIGLGRMLGFSFLENFNYPYIAKSIGDFWRRWHISLSTWFRDYVYIPLGGNRVSKPRLLLNLFVVWLLTGIWHGANFTFIVWGLMYFALLVFERVTGIEKVLPSWLGHLYTMFFVIIGWVLFNADSLSHAGQYLSTMFGGQLIFSGDFKMQIIENKFWLLSAVIFSLPLNQLFKKIKIARTFPAEIIYAGVILLLFLAITASLVKGTYSPFIYFNF